MSDPEDTEEFFAVTSCGAMVSYLGMLRTAIYAVILLTTLSPVMADELTPAQGPNDAAVQAAQIALEAGHASEAIALLVPHPTLGPGACVYGKASERLAKTASERARALLYLERCVASAKDADARSLLAALRTEFKQSQLAQVSLSLRPETATATINSAYTGDILLAEDELWLAPGSYVLEVTAPGHEGGAYAVVVASSNRMLVPIVLPELKDLGPREVDLGEDAGAQLGQVSTTADPRPKKFKTLLAKRYQGGAEVAAGPPEPDGPESSMPWPAIFGGAAFASLGLGVGLQVTSHDTGALLSYGASAGLAGLAVFLLLRDDSPDRGTRIQVDEELISLSYLGTF